MFDWQVGKPAHSARGNRDCLDGKLHASLAYGPTCAYGQAPSRRALRGLEAFYAAGDGEVDAFVAEEAGEV
jgi:hypothetical protein